jgi:hypothetical protein
MKPRRAAQAEYEKAVAQHKLDRKAWQLELAKWRLSKRLNANDVDGEDGDEEQKTGEFTPRPATEPQIGQKLGHVPTLDELHAKALTADPVVKPKRKVKAATPPAPAPKNKPEPEHYADSDVYAGEGEHLETAAELGYGLDKNQSTFGW